MGQALYRKYRSRSLDELVGQDHIKQTLTNALKAGHISHAYLFVGPRGVGKTSVARILAHEINKVPYVNDNDSHLDIIEIDAASNRRIDEMRELLPKLSNAPTSAKYKVIIVDEVHMLTPPAFNALLKTLEEPPEHVIFILATTEAHKLPETIISRTQRFNFKAITPEVAAKHLRYIADKESISIDDEALRLIAEHGEGSFRDSIGILDQVRSIGNDLTLKDVESMLGVAPEESIVKLIKSIQSHDPSEATLQFQNLLKEGSSANQIAKQLGSKIRKNLLAGDLNTDVDVFLKLLRNLLDVQSAPDSAVSLQLALLEACFSSDIQLPKNNDTHPTADQTYEKPVKPAQKEVKVVDTAPEEVIMSDPEPEQELESLESQELWPRVLAEVKKHHNTLYSIARQAKSKTGPNQLILEFNFNFHMQRINEAKNKQIIVDIIKKLTGEDYQVDCVLISKTAPKPKPVVKKQVKPESIAAISNIFGSAEVLES